MDLCPADLQAIARGFAMRHRDEWTRALMAVNVWQEKPLTYDDVFGERKQRVMTPDEQKALLKRLEEKRRARHGTDRKTDT